MCGLAHRRMARILAVCSRLRTAGAPTTPRSALARRWHSSATTAATAPRSPRAGADGNGTKLRARLRPRVRFYLAVDTRSRRVRDQHPASVPATRRDGLLLAAAPIPAASRQAGAMVAALAVCLRPFWMPSLVAATPVSAPIRRGGARDGALAVFLRHAENGHLMADTLDPVGDLDLGLSSGTLSARWSRRQERLRAPGLAEDVRAVPEDRPEAVRGTRTSLGIGHHGSCWSRVLLGRVSWFGSFGGSPGCSLYRERR
jgi:hypothetical protein